MNLPSERPLLAIPWAIKVDITLPSGAVVQYEVMEIGRAEL